MRRHVDNLLSMWDTADKWKTDFGVWEGQWTNGGHVMAVHNYHAEWCDRMEKTIAGTI